METVAERGGDIGKHRSISAPFAPALCWPALEGDPPCLRPPALRRNKWAASRRGADLRPMDVRGGRQPRSGIPPDDDHAAARIYSLPGDGFLCHRPQVRAILRPAAFGLGRLPRPGLPPPAATPRPRDPCRPTGPGSRPARPSGALRALLGQLAPSVQPAGTMGRPRKGRPYQRHMPEGPSFGHVFCCVSPHLWYNFFEWIPACQIGNRKAEVPL